MTRITAPVRRALRSPGAFLRGLLASPSRWPLRTQIWAGTVCYLALFAVLVTFAISGTSSGIGYGALFSGHDPQAIIGSPRAVRSDEYLVATPLVISQVQLGLPRISHLFPGGMDMSILWDLPYHEWSIVLRPQSWGFFFLPLDNAFSFKWWLPVMAMGAVTYYLLCTLWRRPVAALAVSLAFFLSPFFQWWIGAGTFWPPTFGLLIVLVTIWLLRTPCTWARWALGAAAAYFAAVAAVTLYPAYLVPCVLAGAACSLGWLCSGPSELRWASRLRRTAPLLAAAVASGAAVVVYLATRSAAVKAITSTVYPGARSWSTGQSGLFPWQAMYAGVFGQGLDATHLAAFAPNASEGSSFLLVGLYLLPSALWLVFSRWRRAREIDWAIVSALGCLAVFMAFIYLPGWDLLARILLLDKTTTPRIVIGLGVLSLLLLGLVVHRLLALPNRPARWPAAAGVALVGLNHLVALSFLRAHAPAVLAAAGWWPLLVAALALATALFALGRTTAPALLLLGVSIALCGWVNPVYRGVLDLRTSDVGQAVLNTDAREPGAWVTTGDTTTVALLRETAVTSYSGTQGWPPEQMWRDLNPDGSEQAIWDRYAHVLWTAKPTSPPLTLPYPDTVSVALDTCGDFAQHHLDYVLTQTPLDQSCVRLIGQIPHKSATYRIYQVVRPRS